jgi:multidrug efflux pump subunit AcrA (membrane-fusion protein)
MHTATVPSDDAIKGAGMAKRWTGRRVIGAAIALVIVGAIGGTVAMRIVKKINDAPGGKNAEVVVLEFSPADLARVDAQSLSRWLPVSGAVQPLRQATVKAKVSGDVRQVPVREGESVRAGQLLARIDTADLEAKLIERNGALESAKAQLAMAAKTQAMNQQPGRTISQNCIFRNRASACRRAR